MTKETYNSQGGLKNPATRYCLEELIYERIREDQEGVEGGEPRVAVGDSEQRHRTDLAPKMYTEKGDFCSN